MPTTTNLRIEPRQPQSAVCVETTTGDIGLALQDAFPATFGYVGANGGQVAGAPFTRYLEISGPPPGYRIEAGVPTAAPMPGEGRVRPTRLPGGDIAVGDHFGPYDTVVQTAERLRAWVEEQGRRIAGPLWESYITDPGEEPDQEKLHTEVCYPLE